METWKRADVLPIPAARFLGDRRLSFKSLIGQNRKKERLKAKQQQSVILLLTSGHKLLQRWAESWSFQSSSATVGVVCPTPIGSADLLAKQCNAGFWRFLVELLFVTGGFPHSKFFRVICLKEGRCIVNVHMSNFD